MKTAELPGAKWFHWLRNITLRVGVLTGVYLTAAMVIAVLAATRLPFLEDVARIRNWVSYGTFLVVMLVPIVSFRRKPLQLLASGVLGWLLFSLAYQGMGFFFPNLHARLRQPFNVFMVGAIVYGVVAAASWVAQIAISLIQQPAVAPRRKE